MALFENMALQTTMGKAPFKYLGVINDGSQKQGYLEYSTDAVLSKCTKFAVDFAHAGLVHIRSCLTNKYWVRSSANGNWIVAQGAKRVDDKTSWACTLFRMETFGNKKVQFYHVQSGCILRIPNNCNMLTIDPAASTVAVSSTVDYDTLVVLPRFVAFRGPNGPFFNNSYKGNTCWSFSLEEIGDPNAVCEISYTNDGHIRIRALCYTDWNCYWSHPTQCSADNDILTFKGYQAPSPREIFDVIVVDKNVVALRSHENNKICMMTDLPKKESGKNRLAAIAGGVLKNTYLEVVEPVFSRRVKLYEFDLDNARIYNLRLIFSHEHVWNNRGDVTQNSLANGTIKTTKSHSYNRSVNVSGQVSTTIEVGIPLIVEGEISVSASVGCTREWGRIIEETQEIGDTFNVIVKPMQTTRARGVATMGTCDVPFSYVQKDYPTSGGDPIITKLYDGVFTGANAYYFYTDVWYEPLPPYHGPPHLAPPKMCTKLPLVPPPK